MKTIVPLRFGLAAEILSDESDRPPYEPPPVTHDAHPIGCVCERCLKVYGLRGRPEPRA